MAEQRPLLLRNVSMDGRPIDLLVTRSSVDPVDLAPEDAIAIDCRGGRVLPGLIDRHLHLLATAIARMSLDLSRLDVLDPRFAEKIRHAARNGAVRATGVDDADRIDAALLDAIVCDTPVRVLARTGTLWVLNTAAMDEVLDAAPDSAIHFERGSDGRRTGRLWNGDAVLRAAGHLPDLASVRDDLNRWGVTSVTDASVTTDQQQAATIAAACARAGMRQRLTLMGGYPLLGGNGWQVGARKVVLHDADLPPLDWLEDQITLARAEDRHVAVHCVTPAELALTLAAFGRVGAANGDRIEHGAMIDAASIPVIAALGLKVVANPGFVFARGDRYRRTIAAGEMPDVQRLASLVAGGVIVRGASDAPYGPLNPWAAIRAACDRRTVARALLGERESLTPEAALTLYLPDNGLTSDLIVLRPDAQIGLDDDPVALTVIGGEPVYQAVGAPA